MTNFALPPILSTKDLAVGYCNGKSETTVLSHLNLSLRQGELVCLLGANGIGKSTLLRTLSGMQKPLSGCVEIGQQDLSEMSVKQLSNLIGVVYTERTQAGALTVYELVSLGRHPYTGFFGRLSDEDHCIISDAILTMGICHKAQDYVATLSDGERQKAMIARALAQETPIIILDEPTAFLDVASRIETMKSLHRLAAEKNKAILLSSHDINQSLALAGRLWLLRSDGSMVEGVTEDLVLRGELDSMFAKSNVEFDYSVGDFAVQRDFVIEMQLDCEDPKLSRWVTNALNRNGIKVVPYSGSHIVAASQSSFSYNNEKADSIEQLLRIILK